MHGSKLCVAAADIDKDGDIDLFVGGKSVPGAYPEISPSYLLLNDGKGKFTDMIAQAAPSLQKPGLVTDAVWTDVNKDGRPDLIIAGEWMSPTVFLNQSTATGFQLSNHPTSNLQPFAGWWNTLTLADVDGDGDEDLIAGNWGLNSQVRASAQEPLELVCKDFDNNGSIDPILCFYIQGKSYPYVSRDELLDQIYPMRRKFTSYKSYADATIADIFSTEELKDAMKLQATQLETMLFINDNGRFVPKELPLQSQFAPVYKILAIDVNGDNAKDLLLLGNNDYPRLKIGKMDACFGTLLLNDGKGNFTYLPQQESGLRIAGDVKDAVVMKVGGQQFVIAGVNNASLVTYKFNRK